MWLELSLRCAQREWPRIESALEELGALAITLLDAKDQPILEPGVGETPLWDAIVAQALFPAATDRRGLIAALGILVPFADPEGFAFREIADEDWTRAWMADYAPMSFGDRLWVYPSTIEPPPTLEHVVRLDPGLAFGTGTHPTTALCLEWLAAQDLADRTVVDFGCGSGVLAIAALVLGAARVIAVDNDPQALAATLDNAQRNGVAERIEVVAADALPATPCADVLVANILAGALVALAPRLATLARPGAPMALSGVLFDQAEEVLSAYAPHAARLDVVRREDWTRLDLRRNP